MALSFNGKKVNKICFNNNVGYTVVGNHTIVDGVASGFSASGYLQIDNIGNDIKSKFRTNFEQQIKIEFKPTSGVNFSSISYWPNRGGSCGFTTRKDNKIRFTFYKINNYDFYIDTINSFQDNDIVWIKVKINNNLAELFVSSNGQIWTSQGTVDLSSMPSDINTDKYARFGVDGAAIKGHAFEGSIDLNETYIKVNGITWFSGKERASKDVNYVIKDGKLVWANPNL